MARSKIMMTNIPIAAYDEAFPNQTQDKLGVSRGETSEDAKGSAPEDCSDL
jgi:hypothetical protein